MNTLLERMIGRFQGLSHLPSAVFFLFTVLWVLLPGLTRAGLNVQGHKERESITARSVGYHSAGERLEAGKLLVANERLTDPNFAKTVILLVSDNWHGSMGVVINRPSPVKLSAVLPELDQSKIKDLLFIGGPVSRFELLLLIRSPKFHDATSHVVGDVYISGSPEVLERLVDDSKIRFRAYAGYAGWAPGQLDAELKRGDWQIRPADSNIIFDRASEKIWPELIKREASDWVWNSGGQHRLPLLYPRTDWHQGGSNRWQASWQGRFTHHLETLCPQSVRVG